MILKLNCNIFHLEVAEGIEKLGGIFIQEIQGQKGTL